MNNMDIVGIFAVALVFPALLFLMVWSLIWVHRDAPERGGRGPHGGSKREKTGLDDGRRSVKLKSGSKNRSLAGDFQQLAKDAR